MGGDYLYFILSEFGSDANAAAKVFRRDVMCILSHVFCELLVAQTRRFRSVYNVLLFAYKLELYYAFSLLC